MKDSSEEKYVEFFFFAFHKNLMQQAFSFSSSSFSPSFSSFFSFFFFSWDWDFFTTQQKNPMPTLLSQPIKQIFKN